LTRSEVGLLEKLNDPLTQFFWVAEQLYLQNVELRQALKKAGGGNPERVRAPNPSSPGPHRKVFDKKYREIAASLVKRLAFLSEKHSGSKYGWNEFAYFPPMKNPPRFRFVQAGSGYTAG
jgi:hypothetical protein